MNNEQKQRRDWIRFIGWMIILGFLAMFWYTLLTRL